MAINLFGAKTTLLRRGVRLGVLGLLAAASAVGCGGSGSYAALDVDQARQLAAENGKLEPPGDNPTLAQRKERADRLKKDATERRTLAAKR